MISKSIISIFTLALIFSCAGVKTVHKINPETSPVVQKQELETKKMFEPIYYSNLDNEYKSIIAQMDEVKIKPELIQADFKRWMRTKRTEAQNTYKQKKLKFKTQTKKERTEKLNQWHTERQRIKSKKLDRDALQKFYNQQNTERKEYFALEKEQKHVFKNQVKSEYEDLNKLIKERYKAFKDEYKIYKRNYKDYEK